MRVINGETRWKDNDWTTDDGRPVRFILPQGEGGCIDKPVRNGRVRKFRIRAGDLSATESAQYAVKANAPARAMAVFEGDQRINVRPYHKPIEARFRIDVQPGPRITSDWLIVAQWNAAPLTGDRYRNPPASLGIKTIEGVEQLYFHLSTLPYSSPSEQGIAVTPAAPIPFPRGAHDVAMTFVDARGGIGMFRVRVDGKIVCDYEGPTGFANHQGCYFGYGLYRSSWCPGRETVTAHFENVHEGMAS